VRIIGGDFRGRRLASVGKGDAAAHLRPTADRVRESLFNILGSYGGMEGARVLDLFAGTGALGLEALSRGASHACFVETGRASLKILKSNIDLCRVAERCEVSTRDARRLGVCPEPFDLVFLDPPYGKSLGEAALRSALDGGWIAEGALIVWEENSAVTPPPELTLQDERRYGDTMIRIFTRD
jgi:16S rRNA (guanine966-N2)-methyltransferase